MKKFASQWGTLKAPNFTKVALYLEKYFFHKTLGHKNVEESLKGQLKVNAGAFSVSQTAFGRHKRHNRPGIDMKNQLLPEKTRVFNSFPRKPVAEKILAAKRIGHGQLRQSYCNSATSKEIQQLRLKKTVVIVKKSSGQWSVSILFQDTSKFFRTKQTLAKKIQARCSRKFYEQQKVWGPHLLKLLKLNLNSEIFEWSWNEQYTGIIQLIKIICSYSHLLEGLSLIILLGKEVSNTESSHKKEILTNTKSLQNRIVLLGAKQLIKGWCPKLKNWWGVLNFSERAFKTKLLKGNLIGCNNTHFTEDVPEVSLEKSNFLYLYHLWLL